MTILEPCPRGCEDGWIVDTTAGTTSSYAKQCEECRGLGKILVDPTGEDKHSEIVVAAINEMIAMEQCNPNIIRQARALVVEIEDYWTDEREASEASTSGK